MTPDLTIESLENALQAFARLDSPQFVVVPAKYLGITPDGRLCDTRLASQHPPKGSEPGKESGGETD